MGMSEAGDLSDACLYYERERSFILTDAVKKHYNIKMYVRFRDDVIMIMGRRQHQGVFFAAEWDARCKHSSYKIEEWETSSIELPILDLTVSLHHAEGKVKWRPYYKPTSLGIPLCTRSAHSRNIHKGWHDWQ